MHTPQQAGKKIGQWFSIAAWLIVLFFLTLFFNDFLADLRNPNGNIEENNSSNGINEIVLKRNRVGHYVATGEINQHKVEFLLDTGASNVSIPAHLASRLGLKPDHAIMYQTANGNVRGYTTTIDELSLGNITLHNVHGGINPGMNNNLILLGMSFLKKIEFTQHGDRLILRQGIGMP